MTFPQGIIANQAFAKVTRKFQEAHFNSGFSRTIIEIELHCLVIHKWCHEIILEEDKRSLIEEMNDMILYKATAIASQIRDVRKRKLPEGTYSAEQRRKAKTK